MKIILATLMFLACQNLLAQYSFQGLLGMSRGAVNLGADLDYQVLPSHSLGGTFIFAAEKEGVRDIELWLLGADAKVYFGPEQWKVYLAPGLGLASFSAGDSSEMTFGTLLKAGTLQEVSTGLYLGLEYAIYHNWTNDEAPVSIALLNFTLRVDF